ncbi:MAG: carboxypeptidase-like regulatory domain-containing protein, partial [Bacteroides sp.]
MSFALSFPGSVFAETTHGSFVADITQQQTAITGTVTDDAGEPIIGASIVIKGAQTGTITDLDGNFKLNAPKGATLIISYIGYISQEVAVTGKVIHVKLQENT